MKIPHFLFRLINGVMVNLLRSPLHGLFSNSILAIRYVGVRSGRTRTVPVRYLVQGQDIFVTTSDDTTWWPNFREPAQARVLLRGEWVDSHVHAVTGNPNLAGPILRQTWAEHPSDAAYMDVKMRNGEPDPDDFARALDRAVVIRITPAPL